MRGRPRPSASAGRPGVDPRGPGREPAARRRAGWVAALALTLLGGVAHADTATEAGFHFKRGMELVQKGRLEGALAAFFESNRLSPNPSVLHNIGRCLELLGHQDEAFSYFSEFAAMASEDIDRQDAEDALKRVLPKVARLEVVTTPPGAAIYLDRKNLGQFGRSPRLFAVPAGEHAVLVELAGHRPGRSTVILEKGSLVTARVKLVRIVGTVDVTSEPPGARVALGGPDGQDLGRTPVQAILPPGAHALHLSLEGHHAAVASVDVVADGGTQANVRLDPLPPPTGRITVTANLPGALVTLDGKESGFTPAVLDDVVVGEHSLVVAQQGYRPWRGEVAVRAETPAWATITLEPEFQETGRGPWPAVLALTATAALLSGGIFGALALDNEDDFARDPSADTSDRGERLNITADALFVTAGLLGGAAGAMYLLAEPRRERPSTAHVTGTTPAP